jgi:hypothetical protein
MNIQAHSLPDLLNLKTICLFSKNIKFSQRIINRIIANEETNVVLEKSNSKVFSLPVLRASDSNSSNSFSVNLEETIIVFIILAFG